MKQWAQKFYLSQNWKDTSAAYLASQNNICERCGEPAKICHHKTYLTRENINDQAIALSWDNLEAQYKEFLAELTPEARGWAAAIRMAAKKDQAAEAGQEKEGGV